MTAFARNAAAALAALIAGCTFTGLGSYEVRRCDDPKLPSSLEDDPCRTLDQPPSCLAYQCEALTGTCQRRVLDFDRDGDPAPECGGADCDDHDGRRSSS